jgi:lipopolysaccharide biosynthesis glycosyltransferase
MVESAGAQLSVYDISATLDRYQPPGQHLHYTRAAYGRLFMADILPREVRKIIYMDCDVICLKNLRNLWADMTDINLLGAVRDVWIDQNVDHKRHLGLAEDATYYNSGILLINVETWRNRRISNLLLSYLQGNGGNPFLDQDAINYVLARDIVEIPREWNTFNTSPNQRELPVLLTNAGILHYCSGLKPWHVGYAFLGGSAATAFRRAKAFSPWRWMLPDLHIRRLKRKLLTLRGSLKASYLS